MPPISSNGGKGELEEPAVASVLSSSCLDWRGLTPGVIITKPRCWRGRDLDRGNGEVMGENF